MSFFSFTCGGHTTYSKPPATIDGPASITQRGGGGPRPTNSNCSLPACQLLLEDRLKILKASPGGPSRLLAWRKGIRSATCPDGNVTVTMEGLERTGRSPVPRWPLRHGRRHRSTSADARALPSPVSFLSLFLFERREYYIFKMVPLLFTFSPVGRGDPVFFR